MGGICFPLLSSKWDESLIPLATEPTTDPVSARGIVPKSDTCVGSLTATLALRETLGFRALISQVGQVPGVPHGVLWGCRALLSVMP